MFNKKPKSVTMYGVFKANTKGISVDDLLCTTATEDEAYDYITAKVYSENYAHYKMWCGAHDKDEDEAETFEEYVTTVLAQDDDCKYSIVKMHYTYEELASIIRCMLGYVPVGASFEGELEQSVSDMLNDDLSKEDEEDIETNNKVC